MYNIWKFFLSRRAFTMLTMATLFIAGIYALASMPKESTPEVIIPVGIISTPLPGATASDVERLVTDKLEPAVRNVADIDEVTSVSRQGLSIITAQFVASVDIETAIQDLRNAVEGARRDLPSDAEVPTVTKVDFQDQPILMLGIGSDLTPEALTSLGEDLKDDLISVDGVSDVEVSGTRDRQISIIINRDALITHSISIEQVRSALRGANASAPAGTITIDDIDYPIQFKGSIDDIETIKSTPITTPSGTIRVSDVATVIDGFEKASSISRLKINGNETQFALSLNVYKNAGGNILSASNNVKERVEKLKNTLLAGSEISITYDAAEEVQSSINELTVSGVQTVLLVMLVLFIAIGFYEAFVAALAIPFSFLIAFIGMWVTGNTINFLSLFSLIIAIGILVDSSIVIVEGIHTNREQGHKKYEAAKKAIKEFGWPLIAGVSTTVAVFIPLFFLSGVMGQFVKSIPFTIIVVLISSIIVALGFIPTIALGLIKHEESRFARHRERLWNNLATWYQHKMEFLFSHRKIQWLFYGFLMIALIIGISLPITGVLQVSMFPPSDADFFYVEIEMPQATTLSATDTVTKRVEKIVAEKVPYLESYMVTVGSSSVFNSNSSGANTKYANITVNLKEERDGITSLDITEQLRNDLVHVDFASAKISVMDVEGGPPSGAPIVVKIWSNDTNTLSLATEQVERLIEDIPETRNTSSSLANDGTELQITIDRTKAQTYGLSTASVASVLQSAIAGMEATKVRIDGTDIEVRIMSDLNPDFIHPEDTTITTADNIARIPITTARGNIPLGSLITITASRSSSVINHEDGMRIGEVQAYIKEGSNAVEVTEVIKNNVSESDLPEGVHLSYGGEDEEIQRTFKEMIVALITGLILMFTILVLEFDAFRTSLRLLSAIPLSLTGVLWGLFITGQPLSFTAFLGIIALAGIIINHGILLLDSLNNQKIQHPDEPAFDVVLRAAVSRVRPIILTTLTTVVGMIPLTFVSAMWAPLAFTIAFGLIYGTLLTLVFIPLLSYNYERKR